MMKRKMKENSAKHTSQISIQFNSLKNNSSLKIVYLLCKELHMSCEKIYIKEKKSSSSSQL